ncbi:hypothetical protein B0T13DRAFT_486615 [Neurospora crassa]|nr:hypothetical protein B0T13DRAFT_486615 [Neurospora crassa]
MFTGPTHRPTKRVRNSLEYIPSYKKRKAEEAMSDDDSGQDDDTQVLEVVNSFRGTKLRDPPLSHTEPQPVTNGAKRGRGRPRKHPLPVMAQEQPASKTHLSRHALDQIQALARDTLSPAEAQPTRERDTDTINIGAQMPIQGSDSDSDDEFPSLDEVWKRPKNQLPASAQPEPNQEDDYEEREGDNVRAVDEDEEQPDKENGADDRLPRIPPKPRFTPAIYPLLFENPESLTNSARVKIRGSSIRSLREIMMGPGWTDLGKDWAKTVVQPFRDNVRNPTATSEIKNLCKHLHELTMLSDRASRAASITKQNEYLRGVVKWRSKSIEAIQDIVSVCGQHLAPNSVTRQSLRQDLFEYGIPMLILALSSAYRLGEVGGGHNDIDEAGFPQSGMFTSSTVDYLLRITDWITRLETRLAPDVADDEDDEDIEYEHGLKKKREDRQLFKKFLSSWDRTLQQAPHELNEAKFARDQAIKRARQAAREAELAKSAAKYDAFVLSTRRMRSQSRPLDELRQKATRSIVMPRSSGVVAPVSSVPTSHQQQPGSRVSTTSSSQPRVSNIGSMSKPNYPIWSDVKKMWLLDELRKIGPKVSDLDYEDLAEDLGKPIVEVRHEAERLRAVARSLAEEKGTKVERWAQGR